MGVLYGAVRRLRARLLRSFFSRVGGPNSPRLPNFCRLVRVPRDTTEKTMGIQVNNLTKIYDGKVRSLDSVSLTFDSGILGLLGPNGAGKTTLMRILAPLLDPTEGTAQVDGYDVQRQRGDVRRIMGSLPQKFGLYPQMTCREFLDYI